jgi:hypothetical protein
MSVQAGERRALVRSYQAAYRFETMIYKFGDLTLPRPVPARTILYALVVWPAMLLVAYRLPVISGLFANANWLLKDAALPLAVTILLAVAEVQGRRFHVALQAWSRHWLSAKHLAGGYRPVQRPGRWWAPQDIVFISDGRSGAPPEGFRLRGPGRVALRYPCAAHRQGSLLTLRQSSLTPQRGPRQLTLAAGASVRFVPMKRDGAR